MPKVMRYLDLYTFKKKAFKMKANYLRYNILDVRFVWR